MSRPELSHRGPDRPVDPNQPAHPDHPAPANELTPANESTPANQPGHPSPPPGGNAAAESGAASIEAGARPGRRLPVGALLDTGVGRNLGLVAVLAVLCVIGVATASTFATTANLLTILTSASIIGVITVGATMVIIGGGIDLSVGKVMALASVWSTTVATQSYGPAVMVLCALAVGAGAGLVNGLLIAYGRIVPFIATLAMLISAQGLAEQISGKRSQIVTDPTIAAIMITSLTTTGSSTHGTLYELDAIAVVIIGGTLLSGGRGTLARLDPRRAGIHHDHQPLRAQQPGDRGPEHRQGRDHRRRRALPSPRPTDQPVSGAGRGTGTAPPQ